MLNRRDVDVLDAVTPYASTREHVLDEIALVRARALASVGGLGGEGEAAPTPGARSGRDRAAA